MKALADGGGGTSGASNYVVDHAILTKVASGLGAAGKSFDEAGSGRPAAGGTGLAEPLLLSILASASEAAARLAFEASVLAAAVEDCNADAQGLDSQTAANFLVSGT